MAEPIRRFVLVGAGLSHSMTWNVVEVDFVLEIRLERGVRIAIFIGPQLRKLLC